MSYDAREKSRHSGAPVELYEFTVGNETYRYTSALRDRAFKGERFASVALSRTQLDQSQEDHAGSITVTLPASDPVSRQFVAYLPVRPVGVRIYRGHVGDGDEFIVAFAGVVVAAKFTDSDCQLACASAASILLRPVPGALYKPQCNHTLFSQTRLIGHTQACGCNLDKEKFKLTCKVAALDGATLRSAAFGAKPSNWLTYGYVELHSGEVRWITSHSGDSVTLVYPYGADALRVGDTITAYPGCDGSELTCQNKFANIVNFSGFARMPTRNPFTDSMG